MRFHKILKEHAPNVQTILCIGGIEDENATEITYEKEFAEAVRTTDMWSVDNYMALNWGWPYEVAEKDNFQHKRETARGVYDLTKRSFYCYRELCDGVKKPMVMSEFNTDGDVTGPYDQIKMVQEFCQYLKEDPERWFSGFTFYQFRDDGRLGLEITDPNNSDVGIEQPILAAYRDIIHNDFFKPGMEETDAQELPVTLRWGGAEDAEGVCMELSFEGNPVFAEANFNGSLKDANLMMGINSRWFYKAPGVTFIDFMPAFFERQLSGPCAVKLHIFAPPATGENIPAQGECWTENYYYELKELPDIRLRFEPICK